MTTATMTELKQSFKLPHAFTVKADAMFFTMMSGGLYSDPVKAIVREYSTNAVDSHISAKNPEPFEVHLPTIEDPYFSVHDFGTGLSNEDVKQIFCSYFASTKRPEDYDTDEEREHAIQLTGKFGLGSKAALVYTQSMTVVSFFNGTRTRWVIRLNEKKCPEVLEETEPTPTDQPNGLMIRFAVPPKDHHKFVEAACEVYPFFDLQPKFVDCVPPIIEKPKYVMFHKGEKANWGIGNNSKCSRVIMGGVAYPLIEEYDNLSLDLYVDLDTFNMTPSREALRYTNNTTEKLQELIKSATEECHQLLDARYSKCKNTVYDRYKFLQDCDTRSEILESWVNKKHLKVDEAVQRFNKSPNRAISITTYNVGSIKVSPTYPENIRLREWDTNRRGKWMCCQRDYIYIGEPQDTSHITLLVQDVKNDLHAIIHQYHEESGQTVWIIDDNPKFVQDIQHFGFPFEIKKVSELPKPPKVKRPVIKNKSPQKRNIGCFYFDGEVYRSECNLTDKKYYVSIKDTLKGCGLNWLQRQALDGLKQHFGISEDEIVYIKKDHVNKYTDQFEDLFDVVERLAKQKLDQEPHLGEMAWLGCYAKTYTTGTIYNDLTGLDDFVKEHPDKEQIYQQLLNSKLFDILKPYNYTTLEEAIIDCYRLYRTVSSFYDCAILEPYEKLFLERLSQFRDEIPALFYNDKQRYQAALGLPINPFKPLGQCKKS
jgi:hypothetical protein